MHSFYMADQLVIISEMNVASFMEQIALTFHNISTVKYIMAGVRNLGYWSTGINIMLQEPLSEVSIWAKRTNTLQFEYLY